MASTTDDTRDGLLRAEYGVENDTYYYLGTQLVTRKRSGLRPDLIFLSGFEALLPRALAKRLVEALVGLKSGVESVTWFLTDHLGSNIATVDAAGAVIERSQFAPYGERWGKVAERGPGFTGHYEDQSTLTYMKARYYGGIVGRFLSPDPVLTDTADGGNFNRYWYANNNPQKFVDPDGRESENRLAGWGQAVVTNPEMGAAGLAALGAGASLAADFTPILSDAKGFYEAFQDPSFASFTIATVGLIPGAGDAAGKLIKLTYGSLRSAGKKDAHHIIQDAAVRDLPGYNSNAAPAVQLDGPSNLVGSSHNRATAAQRRRGGGTYGAERRIGYRALRAAGISRGQAKLLIRQADDYFRSIGVTFSTGTRIPGNRAR